ncbi:hypothetical protein KY084_05390 [Stakelama sp. CBK3Z-3]|uniref:Type II secretion system protein M n=1 Tax=Stakelama flava TaxID=2860338 RepID=A0ABS6XJC9_9SPHN|nr:hypothetical protein [Stakelama flava]MBW4330305.1 hypothetical protein [Stakelama flava]
MRQPDSPSDPARISDDAPTQSLSGKVVARLRGAARSRSRPQFFALIPVTRREWMFSGAIAFLIASVPVSVCLLAGMEARSAIGARERLAAQAQGALREWSGYRGRRDALHTLIDRPGMAVTIDRIAVALPDDDRLISARRDVSGVLTVEIATADPDRLRAALHREGALSNLRDTDQRQGDGAMLVTLKDEG